MAAKKKAKTGKTTPNGKHPGGRPTIYTPELATEICRRLANGESLRSICAEDGMPDKSTVLLWVVKPGHEFFDHYVWAREAAGYAHGDGVIEVVELVRSGEIDPQTAKAMMDGLKWAAERMSPKAHNPKHVHEHSGPEGGPIEQKIDHLSGVQFSRIMDKVEQAIDEDRSDD